jgi:hypothetical protein
MLPDFPDAIWAYLYGIYDHSWWVGAGAIVSMCEEVIAWKWRPASPIAAKLKSFLEPRKHSISIIIFMAFTMIACFLAYWDKFTALNKLQEKLDKQEKIKPIADIEKASIIEAIDSKTKNKYHNIEISVIGSNINNAKAYLTSLCRLNGQECSDLKWARNWQIGWHKSIKSGDGIPLFGREWFIPFVIDGARARTYFVGNNSEFLSDNSCLWCDDLPAGTYKFSVRVYGNEGASNEAWFEFVWPKRLDMTKITRIE